jgi:hypothetical protein
MTDEKNFEDLTSEEIKAVKVEFAPGCFDGFEGTQEELDALQQEILEMFKDPEKVRAMSRQIDFDNLEEEDEEIVEKLGQFIEGKSNRTLQ